MIKRFSLLLLMIGLLLPVAAVAGGDDGEDMSKREQWFKEMRQKKHEFLVKELGLSDEQKEPFFLVYDKMEDELRDINDQTRRLERSVIKNEKVGESEYDAAINAIYSQRYREGLVENSYKDKLAEILTKAQMIKLKKAEFKFTRALMKQHRQAKASASH